MAAAHGEPSHDRRRDPGHRPVHGAGAAGRKRPPTRAPTSLRSVRCCLEMMAGRKAFEGRSQASLVAAILEHEPPALSNVDSLISPTISRIVATCLAKAPDDRWQTARDLERELTWARTGDTATRTMAAVTARRKWRRALAWSAAVALTALTGTAIGYVSRRPPATDGQTVRFSIYPAPGTKFPRGTAEMAISHPTAAVWCSSPCRPTAAQRLWVRRFDSVSARVLDGTENGDYPLGLPTVDRLGSSRRESCSGSAKRVAPSRCCATYSSRGAEPGIATAPFSLEAAAARFSASRRPAARRRR